MGMVFAVILSFFAVYGALQLLAKGLFCSRSKCGGSPALVHRVIGLQNCQDSAEGIVRSLAWEDIREELILLDLGSRDETGEILRRLEAEYDFIHVMTPPEYRDYMTQLTSSADRTPVNTENAPKRGTDEEL